MGRFKKSGKPTRHKVISVRITEAQDRLLKDWAREAKTTLAAILRQLVKGALMTRGEQDGVQK